MSNVEDRYPEKGSQRRGHLTLSFVAASCCLCWLLVCSSQRGKAEDTCKVYDTPVPCKSPTPATCSRGVCTPPAPGATPTPCDPGKYHVSVSSIRGMKWGPTGYLDNTDAPHPCYVKYPCLCERFETPLPDPPYGTTSCSGSIWSMGEKVGTVSDIVLNRPCGGASPDPCFIQSDARGALEGFMRFMAY